MSENFSRFKSKSFLIRLIKSILIGLAVGALFAGVFLFLAKFEILKIKPILSLPIGLAAALLSGGGGYFLLRSTDKALARRLDEDFALQEKVQTMLAFQGENGAMYELQRKDTEQSLKQVSTNRLKFKRLWAYICLLPAPL